eukprot:scaffold5755_cov143-Skeletonema_marinoi.AAC.7
MRHGAKLKLCSEGWSSTEGVREALGMDRAWTWTWSKNETIYAVACTNIAAAKEECVELTSCE